MTERDRVEQWELQRYGRLPSRWPELGLPPQWRVVVEGPGESVDIPEREIAA